jgi:hypothetical protein
VQFGELTLTLNNPNHAASTNYDIFLFDDAGTLRIGTGPAWSSATARGAGAGTTELEEFEGKSVNKVSITLRNGGTTYGPLAARLALYLGTCRIGATVAQTAMQMNPAAAAGGTNNLLGLWNLYNRVRHQARCRDSTASWTYSSSTLRALNNSNSNRISFVQGFDEDALDAHAHIRADGSSGADPRLGLGLDSTTVADVDSRFFQNAGTAITWTLNPRRMYRPGPGFHFIQAIEGGSSTTPTFFANDTGGQELGVNLWM